jgi:hypothetical protein
MDHKYILRGRVFVRIEEFTQNVMDKFNIIVDSIKANGDNRSKEDILRHFVNGHILELGGRNAYRLYGYIATLTGKTSKYNDDEDFCDLMVNTGFGEEEENIEFKLGGSGRYFYFITSKNSPGIHLGNVFKNSDRIDTLINGDFVDAKVDGELIGWFVKFNNVFTDIKKINEKKKKGKHTEFYLSYNDAINDGYCIGLY